MKGTGNSFGTLFEKLYFYLLPSSGQRTRYINRHKDKFKRIGGVFWQSRRFPSDPELISIGNNVKIASNVIFINHDIAHNMLNEKFNTTDFKPLWGSIEIGNNVMIGAETIILPNVKIGSNVIIGAGSVITKDIPDNVVAAGVPCRVIGGFEQYVEKRKKGLKDRMKC